MYKIKNFLNKRNGFLIIMILTTFLVCVVNASYAFFTATAERKGALNIVSGNLYSLISSGDLNSEKQITVKGNSKETIDVKLTNVNGIEAKFNFYYTASSDNVEVGYTKSGDDCPGTDGIVLPKNGDSGDSKSFVVQITNNSESNVTVTFGSKVGLSNQTLDFPSEGHVLPKIVCKNTTEEVDGLPVNSCEDVDYNDESANKNAMFKFNQPDGSTGYRYIGDDPYNYVKMNDDNSVWRIIGVFNDPDSTGSKTQQRIKLIKDQSVGNKAWDTSNSNNWSRPATLQTELNSGSTYTSLSTTLKGKIEKMRWYLGGYDWSGNNSLTTFFNAERGSKGGNNGSAPTTWDGYVGLMYPSDYGYTYEKGISTTCTGNLNSCSSDSSKGWIRKGHESEYQWTLTPISVGATGVFRVGSDGSVNDYSGASSTRGVRPVVYLKSGTTLGGGDGQETSPYIIVES